MRLFAQGRGVVSKGFDEPSARPAPSLRSQQFYTSIRIVHEINSCPHALFYSLEAILFKN
jgi:hypothetical protein